MERFVEYVWAPAAQAFLEVGVFVAPLLLLFGWVQWRTGGRLVESLARHRRAGPLLGAVLGATPGCGGAIVLMPLHLRGTVSFGTIVAALVATMGDSSFVLLAADPVLGLAVHALLLCVGAAVGFAVDALRVAPRLPDAAPRIRGLAPAPAPSTVGAAAALPRLMGRGPMLAFPSASLVAYWALVGIGLAVGAPLVAGADMAALTDRLGFDPVLVVGGVGILLTLAVSASARMRHDDSAVSLAAGGGSRGAVLMESARETAFVTVWVAVAFVVTAIVVGVADVPLLAGEGSGAALAGRAGLVAVLLGAAVGLIPGCGPQIVLTGLYVQGALPASVLIANALSQDGDALFPLLASSRRAALLGTAISTVPGVVIGAALWAVGL